jgi:MoaA/NifB/PqqE/SkfB family radical SAM enzyme
MSQNTKFNPNILLTEICNLSCPFCFARQRIINTQRREMDICDFRRVLYFLKENGQTEVRLMGGEPTLHSRFKEIVNFTLSQNFKIRLFTNGLFPKEMAHWMAEKRLSMLYSINLNAIAFATEKNRATMENNLAILNDASKINGSITIDTPDFERYTPLILLIDKNRLDPIRIAIANNMVDNSRHGSVADDYRDIVAVVVRLVDELRRVEGVSQISLNCGFTPCMFKKDEIKRLLSKGIKLRGWSCQGKFGSLDISSDLRTFPCYISDDLKNETIFDFKNMELARSYNNDLFEYSFHKSSFLTIKKCKNCSFFIRKECRGPCLGYIYNNKDEKEISEKFRKSLRYKIAIKILRTFRNW